MRLSGRAALATLLLVTAPITSSAWGSGAGELPPEAPGAAAAPVWLPASMPDHLPGVDAARAARLWVSGTPLLSMGGLRLAAYSGGDQGHEGGAEGRAMELKYTGSHCKVYVDSGARPYPSDNTIQGLADEFDTRIWPNNTATFGGVIYGTIDINVINIDGPWGIGGYFSPASPNSVYVDCADINYWGYQIAAHEFEHLIHNQKDPDEELWVNEGCADLAIAIIYGINDGTITGHVDGFEAVPDNDLTVFGNEMYDYGSAYAFIQYFWDQFGGQDSVRALVANKANGIGGIDDTLQSLGYARRFAGLFPEWCMANRLNDTHLAEGQYGYASLSIKVNTAGSWTQPPVSASGDVHRWAADCYYLQNGDGQDLLAQFNSTSGKYAPLLFAAGQRGHNSTILPLALNASGNGSVLVFGFGRDFADALLVVPASAGGSYGLGFRMVDRTPPQTTALVLPALPDGQAGWYTVVPQVTLLSSEEGSRILYWWDDQPEQDYDGTFGAPEGEHLLYYCSVDPAGNRELKSSLPLKVDTVLPETGLKVTPASPDGSAGWYLHPPAIELQGEEGAMLFYSWDGGEASNYTVPLTAPEGKHRLECHSVDEAGNVGPRSYCNFSVDSTAPRAWANLTPASPDGGSGWYRTVPSVELWSDEPSARILFSWDGAPETLYAGPLAPAQGVHHLHYRARDLAGNNGTRLELLLRIDSEPPAVVLTVEPKNPDARNGWYRTRPILTLTLNDVDPGAAAFYAWDGAGFQLYEGPVRSPEGIHTFRFYAVDTHGNRGNESSRALRVDSVAPVTNVAITPSGVGDDWYREETEVALSNSEGADISFWWDGGPSQPYTGPLLVAEGEHQLGFQSRDAAGNTEKARTMTFQVDTSSPVAQLALSAASLLIGDILTADASGSSDANGLELYSIDFGDGYRRSGTARAWDHQYEAPGTYMVTLKVRDKSGAWSEPAVQNLTVSLPPRPPQQSSDGGGFIPGFGAPAAAGAMALAAVACGALSFKAGRRRGRR